MVDGQREKSPGSDAENSLWSPTSRFFSWLECTFLLLKILGVSGAANAESLLMFIFSGGPIGGSARVVRGPASSVAE